MTRERTEAFLSRIAIGAEDECWLWKAGRTGTGRGSFYDGERYREAHRIAWILENGDPGSLFVLHHCDNPLCCNPAHLFLGTQADNIADMVSKGRQRSPRGEKSHYARLSEQQVKEIREIYRRGGITQQKIAVQYGLSQSHVSHIIRGSAGSRRCWPTVSADGKH